MTHRLRTALEDEVLSEIRPTEEELTHMYGLADMIICEINASGKASGLMVGQLPGEPVSGVIVILISSCSLIPPSPGRNLNVKGLLLPMPLSARHADLVVEKYAEHPYVNATIEGLDLDLVPCYQVESATMIQSAVDRTPFHNRYISSRIGLFTDDVLLLKQFVKAGGVYGSDQMTEGFAGYLCEILILQYQAFQPGNSRCFMAGRSHD